MEKVEKELKKIQASIKKGKIISEKERDEQIGFVIKKRRVTRYLETIGEEGSLNFVIRRKNGFEDVKTYEGYQVFVTTEFDLSEREVVGSYKIRDQIEKAIRTLKSALRTRIRRTSEPKNTSWETFSSVLQHFSCVRYWR